MAPITGGPLAHVASTALEGIGYVPLGATGLLSLVVVLLLTDKLIWHTRLRRAEDDRDRWQGIALKALGVADKLTVTGEVATKIVAALPDPAARKDE